MSKPPEIWDSNCFQLAIFRSLPLLQALKKPVMGPAIKPPITAFDPRLRNPLLEICCITIVLNKSTTKQLSMALLI